LDNTLPSLQTMVAPLERVKIIYQVTNEHFSLSKFPRVILDIFQKEGVFSLWRGHSASLLRIVPYAGIQFMTYDYVKRQFSARLDVQAANQSLKLTEIMLCGGTAGAVSTSVTYPLDLARARLAVTPPSRAATAARFHVARSLHSWHRLGGVRELYRGLSPTLLGVVPYGAIAFSTNEAVKRNIAKYYFPEEAAENKNELKVWHKLMSGAFAGIVAQTCTYPLEIMRRRMQTAGHVQTNAPIASTYTTAAPSSAAETGRTLSPSSPLLLFKNKHHASSSSMNMADTFTHLYSTHGWRVFYKGVSLNWIKGPITVSISFTTFDFFKNALEKYQEI
jgi:solute carrier family 25, member 42